MDLTIRLVQLDDAAGIVAILNPIISAGQYTIMDTPLSVESESEYIAKFPTRGIFHVAERVPGNRIVGLQSLESFAPHTSVFDHVGTMGTFIDLRERHKGIGTRLSEATFEAARRNGYEKIFTYVRADNPAALKFYIRLGFRVVGTAQKQARLGSRYIDEVIIERLL